MTRHPLLFALLIAFFIGVAGCAHLSPEPSSGDEAYAWQEEVEAIKRDSDWAAAGEFLRQRQAAAIDAQASAEELHAITQEASDLFHMLEDLQAAALVEERALAAFSERGNTLYEARSRAMLAETLYWLGDVAAADQMTVSALALREDLEQADPDLAVTLLVQRAVVLTDGDDRYAPLEPIERAEDIAARAGASVSHDTRGALFVWLSRIHRQIGVEKRVHEDEGAEVHEQLAREYALKAVAEERLEGDDYGTAIYLEALSRVEWNMDLREEAVAHLGEGLALMEQLGLDRGRDYAALATFMTYYTQRTGRHEEALAWGDTAIEVIMAYYERAMLDMNGPVPDAHAGLTFASVAMLEAVLNGETHSGDLPDATFERIFQVAQLNKMTAMSHAMFLASQDAAGRAPEILDAAKRRRDLRQQWRGLESQLDIWRSTGSVADAPSRLLEAKADLAAEIDDLSDWIADADPLFDRLWRTDGASVAELQNVLSEGEAYILITSLYTDLYVVVVTREAKWVHVAEFANGEACGLISNIRNSLTDAAPLLCDGKGINLQEVAIEPPVFDPEQAHAYYQRVFGPAAELLDPSQTWIINAARTHAALPMGALLRSAPEPGADFAEMDWLGQSKALIYTPSAQALIATRRQRTGRSAAGKLVLAGAPCLGRYSGEDCRALMAVDADRTLSPSSLASRFRNADPSGDRAQVLNLDGLPGAYRELKQVEALEGPRAESLIADAFTEERFTNRDWSAAQTLLIATHALSAEDFSLDQPALVFTPTQSASDSQSEYDGLLTAGEIARIPMNVDLVILSGCSTAGPSGAPRGEMFSGLTLGFLQAGARSILATHFEVEDGFTSGFVPSVLALHGGETGLPVPQALRSAIETLLQDESQTRYHHPRHWAGYAIYGG
ncbi:MAG: CHAT domain-containing protein [Hyphomonadaceae bacterium]|nr:CHAT domain-containing protein [Hyphomonadaceae bacterium]